LLLFSADSRLLRAEVDCSVRFGYGRDAVVRCCGAALCRLLGAGARVSMDERFEELEFRDG
jgi:hypothetical protein